MMALGRARCTSALPVRSPAVLHRGFGTNKVEPPQSPWSRFVAWTTKPSPVHPRWSGPWFGEQALLCTVFAITGSSSMYFVRPVLPRLGIEGSFKEGPWSYRIASVLLVSPIYTALLLLTGSLAGRHNYFAAIARRMWGRFLPKPLAERVGCTPAKMKKAKATAPPSPATSASTTTTPVAEAKPAGAPPKSGPSA